MKKLILGITIFISILTLTACSKKEEQPLDNPEVEEPKQEEPKQEEPKTEEPKQEESKTEEPKTEEPKQEEPKDEITVVDDIFKNIKFELKGEAVVELDQGMYYKNESTSKEYPDEETKNKFEVKTNYEYNGVTSSSMDSTLVGEHKIIYTMKYLLNENLTQSITRIINVKETHDNSKVAPENINKSDTRILNEIEINTSSELSNAVKKALPGDAFILNDGDYDDINMKVEANGTQDNPIFILAKNPGSVIFKGDTNFSTKGAYINIAGINFEGQIKYSSGVMKIEGNYNRISDIKMLNLTYDRLSSATGDVSKHSWVHIAGKYNEIDHSHFEGKNSHGVLMVIDRDEGKEDHHYIHHNYFKDFTNPTTLTNEFELIRIGTSGESRGNSFTRIEYNILDNISAEAENISVKAGRNTIKGNYIINSASSITLRHGTNNIVEDNIIIGNNILETSGIRIYDEGHIIRNNYIESLNSGTSAFRGAIVIHAGNNKIGSTTDKNGQWTPANIEISNNTIINSSKGLVFENEKDRTYGPSNIIFKNNLIVNEQDGLSVLYQETDKTYIDTFIYENNEFYSSDIIQGNDILTNVSDGLLVSINIPTLIEVNVIKSLRVGIGVLDLEILDLVDLIRN